MTTKYLLDSSEVKKRTSHYKPKQSEPFLLKVFFEFIN